MPMFAMIARDKPGALPQRQAIRPEHLRHLDGLGDKLVLAGPFQQPDGQATGSFVVIEAEDLAAANALFETDPYVRHGVFESWDVSRWALTFNNSQGR